MSYAARFLRDLAAAHDPSRHGESKVPFYTFGGLGASSEWAARFRKESLA
jgi:methylenetetrahydrofolate reductase (NADPH)